LEINEDSQQEQIAYNNESDEGAEEETQLVQPDDGGFDIREIASPEFE